MKKHVTMELYVTMLFLSLFIRSTVEVTSVCTNGLCRNNGTCVERPVLPERYTCLCSEGFHGRLCTNKLPEVKCLSDRIVLTVQKRLIFEEVGSVDVNTVYLGNDHQANRTSKCVSAEFKDQLLVILRWPFKACGTVARSSDDNLLFENRLYLDTINSPKASSQRKMVLLEWSCIYPRKYVVSYPFEIKSSLNEPERRVVFSHFAVEMRIYTKPNFDLATEVKPPYQLTSGQQLYVQVELMTSLDLDLVMTHNTCRATNSKEVSSNTTEFTHELILRGCPSDRDPTVKLLHSTTNIKVRFSFRIFKWSGKPQPVYLHCLVTVCNVTRFGESCQPACSNVTSQTARERRSAVNIAQREHDVRLVIGPLRISDDVTEAITPVMPDRKVMWTTYTSQLSTNHTRPEHYILAVLAAVGLVCVVVISVALCKRHSADRSYSLATH